MPAYTPAVADVGALLRARTSVVQDGEDVELGTFTSATRPTGDEVLQLIAQAEADVVMRVGASVPTALVPAARSIVAKRAAVLVEQSYFPEQAGSADSITLSLRLQFEDQIEKLVAAVQLRSGLGEDPSAAIL